MDKFTLRPAQKTDLAAIRNLVRASNINPTGLKWPRFILAETPEAKMIACGQIKPHIDGSMEIASLAVQPDYRGKGIAKAIVEELISDAPRPLYLMCRAELGTFYEKFGFYKIELEKMPPYFRRISQLASLAEILAREGTTLLVMRCD